MVRQALTGQNGFSEALPHIGAGTRAENSRISDAGTFLAESSESNTPAPLHLLGYVPMRRSTGAPAAIRAERTLMEHLAVRPDIRLRVLAPGSAQAMPPLGELWDRLDLAPHAGAAFRQTCWYALHHPRAERWWPEAQVVFCTAESYVPTRRARLAVTLHGATAFEPESAGRGLAHWKKRVLYRRLQRKADMFHTASHFSTERLTHFFPALRGRMRVVPPAVSPLFFAPAKPQGFAFLAAQGLGPGQEYESFVLLPGGLHARNAELILAAVPVLLRQFPRLAVAVTGRIDPRYTQAARQLSPRFRMPESVSDAALRALYGAASVVWFPSRYEDFALPVLEAMACGAPVVASGCSGLAETAGGAALLVEYGSAHADAVASLLTDSGAAREWTLRGLERAAECTAAHSAATLTGHLRDLL